LYVEDMLPPLVEDMTGSKWDRERKRVIEILREKMVIDRTLLSRLSHLTGEHLTAHLRGLLQDKLITTKEQIHNTGRPVQYVSWVGD
jgi:hypothetical protein